MSADAVEFRFRLGRRDVRSVEELREQAAEHKQRMQEFAALLQSAFDTGVRAIEVTDRTRRHALLIQQQRDGILRVGRFDDRGAVGHIEVDPGRYEELGREIFSMLSADPDDRSHLTVRLLPPSRSLVEFWLQQPLGKWGMDLASVVHESNQLRARGDYEGAHRVEAEALARMGPAPAPTPIPDTVGTAPGAVSLSALVSGLPDGVVPVGRAVVRVYRVGPLHKDKRGLFFAGSPESAGAYSSLHSGHQVQSYVVTVQNAVKASGPHQLWRHFFGKPLNLAEIDVRRKFNDIRKALRWADERLAAKVRAAGYDALIYTSPPPPAEMELAVVAPTARVVPDATPTVGGSVDLESRLKDLRLAFWKGDAAAAATALRLVDELAASGDPAAQVVRLRAIAGFSTPGRGLPWQAAGLPAIDVQAELATVLDSIPRTRAAWETLVRAIVPADLADVVIKRKNVAQLRAFVEHEVTDAGHRARIEAWGAGLREETTSGHAEGRRVIAGCSSYPYPPVDVDSLETMGWVLRDYHRRWLAENLGCVLLVPVADLVPAPGEPFYEPDSRYIRSYVAHWDSPGHRHYVPDGFWREDGRVEVTDGRHRISAHRARGGMEVPIFVGHDSRFLRAGTTAGASRPWTTRQYGEQVLHLNVGRRLGEGGFGEVYALPGGKVIKFTHSDAERACATWVKKHKRPSPHLPRVYRSGEIPEYTVRWVGSEPRINDQHGTGPRFWYIREEVPDTYAATVPGESRAAKVALLTPELHEAISADIQRAAWRLWHDHRLWLMPDFALLRQWGRRADGTIVLRDLACGTPEEGVNPETQEGGRLPETEPPPWYPETAGGAPTEYEVLKHQLTRPRATRFPARVECRPEPERIQKWLDFYPLGPVRTLERMRALQGRRGIWIGIDTILNLLGEHFPSMADADTNVPEHVQQLASGVPLAGPVDLRLRIPPGSGEDEAPGLPAPFAELALVEEIVDRSLAHSGSRRAWRDLGQFRHAAARMIWRALRSLANRAGTLNVDEGFAHYAACWEQRMEDRLRFQIPAGRGDVISGPVEASPRNPYPPGSSENLLFSEMVEMAAKYPDEANAAAMAAFALRQSEPRYAAWPEVVSNLVAQGLLRPSYATEISPENFDGRFTIPGCPVVWDSRNGLGATGNNADIRWFGFMALMRPETFLRLALPLGTPRERSTSGLERYRILPGWGPPMLYIDVSNRQMIRVVGHEGRHRAIVFARLCPDALMPVAFMPRYKRAKDMTPDVLQDIRVRMISEGDGFVFGPLFDEVFVGDVALHLWDDTTVGSATVGGRLWNPGINWASDAIVLRERAGVLEVLLGLQNPKQTGGRRQWALLGGFRDNNGETGEQAARREAREEGGINLQRHHLIGKTRVYGGKGTRYDPRDEADRWIQTQGFVYLVAPSMEPRCVQDPDGGIIDARFVPVEMALRRRLRASHNQLLADAVELWRRQRPM